MLRIIKGWALKIIEHLLLSLIALAILPFIISYITGNLENFISFIKSGAPWWSVITVALISVASILYTVKTKTVNVKVKYMQPEAETFLMEDSGVKWKVTDHKNGHLSIETVPYCDVHNAKYVHINGDYLCPEVRKSDSNCKILDGGDLQQLREFAESKADTLINKYKTKA